MKEPFTNDLNNILARIHNDPYNNILTHSETFSYLEEMGVKLELLLWYWNISLGTPVRMHCSFNAIHQICYQRKKLGTKLLQDNNANAFTCLSSLSTTHLFQHTYFLHKISPPAQQGNLSSQEYAICILPLLQVWKIVSCQKYKLLLLGNGFLKHC